MPSDLLLATTRSLIQNQIRTYITKGKPKVWRKDGVKYGHITYYPRTPNHVDPVFQPSKLFLVERVKPYRGNPRWDKDVLKQLKLDSDELRQDRRPKIVVKNIPEMCKLLWQVKHLIKVTPIALPDKLPDNVNDISTYLHENGKLYVFPKIDERRYKATEEFINNPKRMDNDTITEHLRLRWINGNDLNI